MGGVWVEGLSLVDVILLVISVPAFTKNLLAGAGRRILFLEVLTHSTSASVSTMCSGPTNLTFVRSKFRLSFGNRDTFRAEAVASAFTPFTKFNKGTAGRCGNRTSTPFIPDFFTMCGGNS